MIGLEETDVHLWRVSLRVTPDDVSHLQSLLSAEERVQADKLLSHEHRARYTTCRAAVRQILGMYLERPPEQIRFFQSGSGKPCLLGTGGGNSLRFNVSQSRELAVLAVASNREIGVDIEAIRPVAQLGRIADRVLAPAEKDAFLACRGDGRLEMFFQCWTEKKACAKALGMNPRIPLDRVELDVRPGAPIRLHQTFSMDLATRRFTVCDFIPQNEFCGAFAVQGRQLPKVRHWKWFKQL